MGIKREYEEVTHVITEKVLKGKTLYCDICNKIIDKNKEYWELTTGHNDWDNDSVDSIENFDVCSESCLRKKFDEYVKESGEKINNSMYFNVERGRNY